MPDATTVYDQEPLLLYDFQVHPAAAVFPLLADEELRNLAADIKEHGLNHPIVLDKNRVLIDGRNRLAACNLAGVEPSFTTLADGVDPIAFILSENIYRRHLSKGQQAMTVVMAAQLSAGGKFAMRRGEARDLAQRLDVHSQRGEFNRSSQHPDGEELRWRTAKDAGRIERGGPRCALLVGRWRRDERTGSDFGRRSGVGCPARTRR